MPDVSKANCQIHPASLVKLDMMFIDWYSFFDAIGVFVVFLIHLIIIIKVYRKPKYLLLMSSYVLILIGGRYLAIFVRALNSGLIEEGFSLSSIFESMDGSHFLGYILMIAFMYYPLVLLSSTFIMEPKVDFTIKYVGVTSVAFPVEHIFNRIACISRGCCYGIEYNGLLSYHHELAGHRVFPSKMLEIVMMAVLTIILIVFIKKGKNAFGPMLIGFGITFFVSEYFMYNPGIPIRAGMDYIQLFSILTVIAGIVFILLTRKYGTEQISKKHS